MGGISVFIKYSGISFTNEKEFDIIRRYIIDTYFSEISDLIDKKTEGISQIWFVPFDPEVYYNYENIIDLPIELFNEYDIKPEFEDKIKPKLCKVQYNSIEEGEKTLDFTSLPSINDSLRILKFKTQVKVYNRVIDLKNEEYTTVYVPRVIYDGYKRSTYTCIFTSLLKLNPEYIEHIVSFLSYVNQNNTLGEGMSQVVFNKFILGLIKSHNTGRLKYPHRIKRSHINPEAYLSPREKSNLMNRVNGILKKASSIKLISDAKQSITEKGDIITKNKVVKITKLSRPTINKYWNESPIDIQSIIDEINENYIPSNN